jgi:hypothetical protein
MWIFDVLFFILQSLKISYRKQMICNVEVPYNAWLEYDWQIMDHLIIQIYT